MMSKTFDADFIVIGSGPAGVSAAIPLVNAGRRVIMLDAASAEHEQRTSERAHWQVMLGDQLEALRPEDDLSPKLRTPESRAVVGAFRQWVNICERDFFAIGALARGGLSRIWGSFVSEFDNDDLHDWPVKHEHLAPSYRVIAARIGVSGSRDDDMADFYGRSGPILPAPPIGPTAKVVLSNYQRRPQPHEFTLGLARNALLTADRGDRLACDLSRNCLWGCPRGAIYDARSDLALLQKSACFSLLDGALVVRLSPTAQGWSVVIAGRGEPLRAPRIVLAAGTLGSLRLALPLLEPARTELRLLSSPLLAVPMLVWQRLGGAPPPKGYTLAQLGFTHVYSAALGDYVTGALYEVSALPPSPFVARLPFGRRAGTEIFRALAPALAVASIYFPGGCSANSVRAEMDGETMRIAVRGSLAPEFTALSRTVQRRLSRIFRRLGAYVLPATALAQPGTDAHLGGLFPMGASCGTNVFGEFPALPGLHLVDGSIFPTIPSKPNTLTIMANADRIARHLAQSSNQSAP
jgi:choline dehydrogenase-like flavoprotein